MGASPAGEGGTLTESANPVLALSLAECKQVHPASTPRPTGVPIRRRCHAADPSRMTARSGQSGIGPRSPGVAALRGPGDDQPCRRRPSIRTRADPGRGDAQRRAGGPRLDHSGHGRPLDRRRPRRVRQFPWLFSIFLLAQAVSIPIFAKLSDLFGRKPIMLIGVGAFVLGSILLRPRLEHARADRLPGVQGLGAGAVHADDHDDHRRPLHRAERAKVQGYVASVWAMSSVVGPTLGGLFVDFATGAGSSSSTSRWGPSRPGSGSPLPRAGRADPSELDLAGAGLLTAGARC